MDEIKYGVLFCLAGSFLANEGPVDINDQLIWMPFLRGRAALRVTIIGVIVIRDVVPDFLHFVFPTVVDGTLGNDGHRDGISIWD